ncbi:hypothetical protein LTR22_013601 [Elasticomyces elasticus]|nr:hypothetical protein LTR22_013601 [Elasticomyces elasticus]KAK4929272.1 hypothetical protein LTR49_004169 [Elasticomyces elasticus]KAK5765828.1 hypothetical protein LTS12_004088 [Elasticomyces elasticus]
MPFGGPSSGNGAKSKIKRETAAKGVQKKVKKKGSKETRPKVLQRLANRVAVKAREVARKEEKSETRWMVRRGRRGGAGRRDLAVVVVVSIEMSDIPASGLAIASPNLTRPPPPPKHHQPTHPQTMATLPHRAIAPPRPVTRSDIPPKRQKQSRPEIWSNLLRRTREAQARNRLHSIQHRELVICGGSPSDQHSFVQSLARPPPAQPPRRDRDAQRQQKVRGEVKLSNRFAYGYGHVTLYTPLQQGGAGLGLLGSESEEAVRLEIHTVPEAEEGYERTLRRLLEIRKGKDEGTEGEADEGFAGGDVKVEEGRRPAVALLLSWKEPWKFLALLRRWLQLLASALLPADAAPEDPLEVLKEHKIALTVVVQHVEAQESLEREDYREETFDYISQCLRTCLLPLSAALIYTSASLPPQQPGAPLSEIQKVLYASLSLDLAPLSPAPAKGTTPANRSDLDPKHCLVDRMAILIPSNWDSAGKIRLLSETFTPETVLEAWVADLNIPIHQPPKPVPDGTAATDETKGEQPTQAGAGASRPSSRETEQVFTSTSDAGEEDPDLTARALSPDKTPISAITTYETAILDPAAHKAPQPPRIEVTTTPPQIFLADMRAHLLQLEAEDAKTAAKQGDSGRDRVATTGSAVGGKSGVGVPGGELTGALGGLGDVQFNLGGVSYNAEAAIERLRKGSAGEGSPGGGGGYGGLASSSPRTTTPRPPRREDREVSASTPLGGGQREVSTGSARGGGGKAEDLPVDDLKEYFRSLAKRSGGDGGSGSSTPSRGPSGKT